MVFGMFCSEVVQKFFLAARGLCRGHASKVELQSELDNSRIVARRDDATEVAGSEHLSCRRVYMATGGNKSV